MDYRVADVPLHLAPWVRSIWRLKGQRGPDAEALPILPDGCAEIVFNIGAPMLELQADGTSALQASALLVGQMTSVTNVLPTGAFVCWGVKLQPWAVGAFAGVPAHAFEDEKILLGDAVPALRDCAEQLADAETEVEQENSLRDTLERYCTRLRAPDIEIEHSTRVLDASRDRGAVRALAKTLAVSERSLELRFARAVGTSPKRYERIRRFQRVVSSMMEMSQPNWAAAAVHAGYYDQAHLIRDTRDIARCTPSQLFPSLSGVTEFFVDG